MGRLDTILDECISRIVLHGETPEQCLARYPEYAEELAPQLATVAETARAAAVPISLNGKTRARAALEKALKEVEQRDALRAARPSLWARAVSALGVPHLPGAAPRPAYPRWAAGIAVAVLALGLSVGGVAAATNDALPGDALYPVKLAVEQVSLTVQLSDEERAALHAEYAARRAEEAARAAERGNDAAAAVALDSLQQHAEAAGAIAANLDAPQADALKTKLEGSASQALSELQAVMLAGDGTSRDVTAAGLEQSSQAFAEAIEKAAGKQAPAPAQDALSGRVQIRVAVLGREPDFDVVVQAHGLAAHLAAGSASRWIPLSQGPMAFDLPQAGEDEPLLGEYSLPAGSYTQVQVEVDAAVLTANGQQHAMEIIRPLWRISRPFRVDAGKTTVVVLGLDPRRSFNIDDGAYVLKPAGQALVQPAGSDVPVTPSVAQTGRQHNEENKGRPTASPTARSSGENGRRERSATPAATEAPSTPAATAERDDRGREGGQQPEDRQRSQGNQGNRSGGNRDDDDRRPATATATATPTATPSVRAGDDSSQGRRNDDRGAAAGNESGQDNERGNGRDDRRDNSRDNGNGNQNRDNRDNGREDDNGNQHRDSRDSGRDNGSGNQSDGDRRQAQEVRIRGQVEFVRRGLWRVDGRPVVITEDTRGDNGVDAGDRVEVRGVQQDDGSVAALEVTILQQSPTPTPVPRVSATPVPTPLPSASPRSSPGASPRLSPPADRDGGDRGDDRSNQRGGDRANDRPNERGDDRSTDRSSDRGNDQPAGRGNNQSADQPSDRGNDRSNDRGNVRSNDQGNDRSNGQGNARSSDQGNDRSNGRPNDQGSSRGNDQRPRSQTITVDGAIQTISATQWTVAGRTILLNADTRVQGAPERGRRAHVDGQVQDNGAVLAIAIQIQRE